MNSKYVAGNIYGIMVYNAREFISLGTLNDVVENQDGAMIARLEDEYVLVFGFLVMEDLIDFEGQGLTGPHVGGLAEPAIYERKC